MTARSTTCECSAVRGGPDAPWEIQHCPWHRDLEQIAGEALTVIPETIVIFGLVVAIMILQLAQ